MLLIVDRSNQELHRANASSVMSQDGSLENVAREVTAIEAAGNVRSCHRDQNLLLHAPTQGLSAHIQHVSGRSHKLTMMLYCIVVDVAHLQHIVAALASLTSPLVKGPRISSEIRRQPRPVQQR